MDDTFFLAVLIFAAGALYSTVGHAGASGYLAVMALFGLAPEVMKPAALVLNVFVATIASFQFSKAGHFSWGLLLPFIITSIPFAFIGGTISLPGEIYKPLLGIVLLFSAYRFFQYRYSNKEKIEKPVPLISALIWGAGIGLLSGAIGVGGGIFLSPLIIFMGWAGTKKTAGVSAVFILFNSIAGILGHLANVRSLPDDIYLWAAAAALGGVIGSHLGCKSFSNSTLYGLLGIVLAIAGLKFMII